MERLSAAKLMQVQEECDERVRVAEGKAADVVMQFESALTKHDLDAQNWKDTIEELQREAQQSQIERSAHPVLAAASRLPQRGWGVGMRPWCWFACLWRRVLPVHILTLCESDHVLVVSTEPLDDLSCLTTPGSAVPEMGCCPCH